MGRIKRRLALLMLTLLLAGCGLDHGLDLSNIKNLKYSHEGTAGVPQPLSLSTHSKEYESLVDWLKQNRSGWKLLEATLLPGGLSIYGDDFDLRVIYQTAVLGYLDESGQHRLLYKKIPTDMFAFLIDQ